MSTVWLIYVVTESLLKENAKITCVREHKLSSAGAKGQNDDSNLQYYTTAQPGADTLIIKAKFTL